MEKNLTNRFRKLADLYAENAQPSKAPIGIMENVTAYLIDEAIETNCTLFADKLSDLLRAETNLQYASYQKIVIAAEVLYHDAIMDDVFTCLKSRTWMNETQYREMEELYGRYEYCSCGKLLEIIYSVLREEKPHKEIMDALDLKQQLLIDQNKAEVTAELTKNHPSLSLIHPDVVNDRRMDQSALLLQSQRLHREALEKHIVSYERQLLQYEGKGRKEKEEGIRVSRQRLIQEMAVEIAKAVPEGLKREKYYYKTADLMRKTKDSLSIRDMLYGMNANYLYICSGESEVSTSAFLHHFEELILLVELATGTDTENVREWKGIEKSRDYLLHYLKARHHLHDLEKKGNVTYE